MQELHPNEAGWQTFIKAGCGFHVGQDFDRVTQNTLIRVAPAEYANPGHVIGYIAGDMGSSLGFMRKAIVRVHVRKDCLMSVECVA